MNLKNISKKGISKALLLVLILSAVILWIINAVSGLDKGQNEAATARLEEALRRSAVACYAAEGVYPPSLDYLCEKYGVQIDKERYDVFYEIFADNLMPDITVVPKEKQH